MAETLAIPTETPVKTKKRKGNLPLAASLVASGVTVAQAAKESGYSSASSLNTCLRRKGVTATKARAVQADRMIEPTVTMSTTLKLAQQAGEVIRRDFGEILSNSANKLKSIKPKASLKHIKAIGEAIEPLVRSAKIVHGWGNDAPSNGLQLQIVNNVRIDDSSPSQIEQTQPSIDSPANSTIDVESNVTDIQG